MKTRLHHIAQATLLALIPACDIGSVPQDPDGGPTDPVPDARPPVQQPPVVEQSPDYKRGSLEPLFEITPQAEFNRFEIFGQGMATTDFTTAATRISTEAKLLQVQGQIEADNDRPFNLLDGGETATRARGIPFRGNPTDVKIINVDGKPKAYVPLGGGVGDPGHEVAAVDLTTNEVELVRVGIHPQRVAVHEPSGLVFVCNQYSNYISIIDARRDELLEKNGQPVEIPTEFYCADLLLVQRTPGIGGEVDELFLFVANEFRASVLKYQIDIERAGVADEPTDVVVTPPAGAKPHIPIAEITGVGKNPYRLSLNEAENGVYVANNRGGELALIDIQDAERLAYLKFDAPTMDVLNIRDKVYVPTTTPFRGLLKRGSQVPDDVDGPPIRKKGIDGEEHVVHPGAMFDDTDSYNFEDLRNGIFQVDLNLRDRGDYFTDDNDGDDFFVAAQKQLAGAIPWDIERNASGTQVFVAMLGSDVVQSLDVVDNGTFRLRASGTFQTSELPAAVALNEAGNELIVVTMGGEFLERFDLDNGNRLAQIDLGYAEPRYPATVIEAGEYFYATAKWSNDGRKACTSCHVDRFLTDGVGYSNGATAPTAYHQVKPNYNLMTTDGYFWNGSFVNNSYASVAFAAQSRTNCELVLFGLIEGVDKDPADRVGDPVNFTLDPATDAICRPDTVVFANGLPVPLDQAGVDEDFNNDGVVDFADIGAVINAQKQVAFGKIGESVQEQLQRIGQFDPDDGQLNRDVISRAMDFYGAAELRLPPNPVAQMARFGMLRQSTVDKIEDGEAIFRGKANCASCHDPDNARHPFTDGRNHGKGAGWMQEFFSVYNQDARLLAIPGLEAGIPEQLSFAAEQDFTRQEINVHNNPLDYFEPFCFDIEKCLVFNDPLAVQDTPEEDERLFRLAQINLADPDRGWMPGQVIGRASVNTPSLRGVWLQHNLLRHGLAFSIREAILGPGHSQLRDGEVGWAIDSDDELDVHGVTSGLSKDEVEALELYVQSIE
jgi:DNA-binding beta-propeller fold protein YncE